MPDSSDERETVSIEAHNRVKTENDELKTQLANATKALEDVAVEKRAVAWFKAKGVADADDKALLVLPHIRDVEPEKLDDFLSQDRFKSLVSTPAPPPDPGKEGEGEPPGQPEGSNPPPPEGFGGPNPAGNEAPPKQGLISRKSPEYIAAVQRNDRDQIKQWYDEGRLATPTPTL